MAYVVEQCSDGNVVIFCEGCGCAHKFYIESGQPYLDGSGRRLIWKWNGNRSHPTFEPSLIVCPSSDKYRCHTVITDGWIQFLGDCGHALKGQRIQLQPFTEEGRW